MFSENSRNFRVRFLRRKKCRKDIAINKEINTINNKEKEAEIKKNKSYSIKRDKRYFTGSLYVYGDDFTTHFGFPNVARPRASFFAC